MNVVKEIKNITDTEVANGIFAGITGGSWHEKYSASAWVFVGTSHSLTLILQCFNLINY